MQDIVVTIESYTIRSVRKFFSCTVSISKIFDCANSRNSRPILTPSQCHATLHTHMYSETNERSLTTISLIDNRPAGGRGGQRVWRLCQTSWNGGHDGTPPNKERSTQLRVANGHQGFMTRWWRPSHSQPCRLPSPCRTSVGVSFRWPPC